MYRDIRITHGGAQTDRGKGLVISIGHLEIVEQIKYVKKTGPPVGT
jgi:hypothetical protein